jgi:hypothetical protein
MAKKKRRVIRPWSAEDVKTLRALAKARLSGPQVAKKLRRTRSAVAQKAMKLGVRFISITRKLRSKRNLRQGNSQRTRRRLG